MFGRTATGSNVNLRGVLSLLWQRRRLLLVTAGIFGLAGLAYALLATEIFRAETLVLPKTQSSSEGASLIAQFGGVAQLAGLSVREGNRGIALATLKSRHLIETFIREQRLLQKLYEDRWDAETKAWRGSSSNVPTTWEAYNYFTRSILEVEDDPKTGLVTVAVEWKDPVEARQWVAELIARTNAHLKSEAVQQAERNLAYLQNEAAHVGQVEIRSALFSLVETELKALMIAKGDDEFALRTIDEPVVPEKRARPKRALIVTLAVLVGLFVGLVLVFLSEELAASERPFR